MQPIVDFSQRFRTEVQKAIVGQEAVIEQVLVAILAGGHALLEGVPGIAKTLLVRSTAAALDLPYSRVQFTPDLMPSDVIGTNIFDQKAIEFKLRKGAIFTSILLADEINRTPPKTQSALLEAMEERQVTIDGTRHPLPVPFFVFATQNPIEYEGTYPLPEAQQDRFMLKILLDYPTPEVEQQVYSRVHAGFSSQNLSEAGIETVSNAEELGQLQALVRTVRVDERMISYLYDIVASTRKAHDVAVGASPRAGIAFLLCGKALAALRGRDFLIPDDLKDLALPILRHRVILRPEAEIEGLTVERVLTSLVEAQTVPR